MIKHYPDASSAAKHAPHSQGVPEGKGNRSEPSLSTSNPSTSIVAIRERLGRIVTPQLELMEKEEIIQLSDQHNSMLQQLASVSLSGSSSAASSDPDPSNSLPVSPVPTYAGVLSAPKAVTSHLMTDLAYRA